jgi:hypothetical protein
MAKKVCDPRMTATCEEKVLKTPMETGQCPSWELCLPFAGKLISKGGCIELLPGTPPPDGVYGKVVVANGCIVGLEKADIPIYSAPPCAPVPCDCGSGGGGGDICNASTEAGNLFSCDASGRPLVKLWIKGGDAINVTGNGTANNPYIIDFTGSTGTGGVYIRSGNNAITVSGSGSTDNPYEVTHKKGLEGKYGTLSFDEFGHLIEYTPTAQQDGIMGLKEGRGICIDTDVATGIATIGLCDQRFDAYTGTVQLGGFNVEIKNGEVVDVTRVINLPAGTYTFGKYDVTINEYGSITNIVERTATTGDDYMGCEYVGIWNQLISNDPALENMNNYVRDFILEFDAPKDSQWVFTIDYKGAFLIDGVLVNGTNVLVPPSGNASGAIPLLKLTDAFNFTPSVSADAGISVSVSAYSRYVFRPNMTFAAGHYEVRFRVNTDEYVTNWVRLPQFVASIKLVGNAAHSLAWVNSRD